MMVLAYFFFLGIQKQIKFGSLRRPAVPIYIHMTDRRGWFFNIYISYQRHLALWVGLSRRQIQ